MWFVNTIVSVCEHQCLGLWTSVSWFVNINVLVYEHQCLDLWTSLSRFVNIIVSVCEHQCLSLWTSVSLFVNMYHCLDLWTAVSQFVNISVLVCEHLLLSWFVNIIVLVCEHVSLSWFVNSIQGRFWFVLNLGFMYELWSHWLWLEPVHCYCRISRHILDHFVYLSLSFQYLRLSNKDSVDSCLEFMQEFWRIMEPSPPNLVISVVGGAKNFRLDGEMRDTFSNGLIKVGFLVYGLTHAGLSSLSVAWHIQGWLPCLLLDTYRVGFLVYCLTHTGLASLSVAWHRVGIQYGLTHTGWLSWPWLHTYRVGFLVLGLTHTGLGWFSCLWLDTCRVGLASLSMAWCTQGWLPWPWLDTYRVGFLVYDLKYTCVRACVRACVCVRVCMCVQRRDQGMRGAEIEWTMLQLAFLSIWYWCMHL